MLALGAFFWASHHELRHVILLQNRLVEKYPDFENVELNEVLNQKSEIKITNVDLNETVEMATNIDILVENPSIS